MPVRWPVLLVTGRRRALCSRIRASTSSTSSFSSTVPNDGTERLSTDALTVPVGCLLRAGTGWAVFVVTNGRAVKREVKLGARTASDAWIEAGLSAGEQVIVYPSEAVRDGVRVDIVRSEQRNG